MIKAGHTLRCAGCGLPLYTARTDINPGDIWEVEAQLQSANPKLPDPRRYDGIPACPTCGHDAEDSVIREVFA